MANYLLHSNALISKLLQEKIGSKLTIDASQKVKVERCGNPEPIVISREKFEISFLRSTPMMALPCGPTWFRTRRKNNEISEASRLLMVDPGKKAVRPSAGTAEGISKSALKSATTGLISNNGKLSRMRATVCRRKCSAKSIGTYKRSESRALIKISVLTPAPAPYSRSAAPCRKIPQCPQHKNLKWRFRFG